MSHFDSNESQQVWGYFHRSTQGTFVDVGANHPVQQNQTWFLEQQGWTGVCIEPNPEMAQLLRQHRPNSKIFQVAAGNPAQVGEVEFQLAAAHRKSALKPDFDVVLTGRNIRVPLRTLDSVLEESGLQQIDFLSLDVEEMELDVLAGFDLKKWKPKLILIEDFLYDGCKRAYLQRCGYKLIRRTGYNNWYVPQESRDSLLSVGSPMELFNLARKMWISGPLIGARRAWRRRRAQKGVRPACQ